MATTPTTDAEGNESLFLEAVRADLPANTQIPDATDQQLLAAGVEACQVLDSNTSPDDMSVIDGETRDGGGYFRDSSVIITAASLYLCD